MYERFIWLYLQIWLTSIGLPIAVCNSFCVCLGTRSCEWVVLMTCQACRREIRASGVDALLLPFLREGLSSILQSYTCPARQWAHQSACISLEGALGFLKCTAKPVILDSKVSGPDVVQQAHYPLRDISPVRFRLLLSVSSEKIEREWWEFD